VATFGDTNVEASSAGMNGGSLQAYKVTSPSNAGTLTDLNVNEKGATNGQTVYLCLYADDAGGARPGTLLVSGTVTVSTAAAWRDLSGLGYTLAPSTNYWIAIFNPTGNSSQTVTQATSGGTNYFVIVAGATPPNPAPAGGTGNVRLGSAYAVYTPSGGSTPVSDSDTAAETDAVSTLAAAGSDADTAANAETNAVAASVADADTAANAETVALSVAVSASDSATLTETSSVNSGGTTPISSSDSATLGETAVVFATAAAADTATETDLVSALAVALAVADVIAEAEQATFAASIAGTDTVALSEAWSKTSSGDAAPPVTTRTRADGASGRTTTSPASGRTRTSPASGLTTTTLEE